MTTIAFVLSSKLQPNSLLGWHVYVGGIPMRHQLRFQELLSFSACYQNHIGLGGINN